MKNLYLTSTAILLVLGACGNSSPSGGSKKEDVKEQKETKGKLDRNEFMKIYSNQEK